jgi:hypothetical protein
MTSVKIQTKSGRQCSKLKINIYILGLEMRTNYLRISITISASEMSSSMKIAQKTKHMLLSTKQFHLAVGRK